MLLGKGGLYSGDGKVENFPGSVYGKEPACQYRRLRDSAWIPGSGRAPGEGNGNTPAFLPGKSHGRGAWQATVHRVAKSDTTEVT